MTELHVIPDERTTTWRVFETDAAEPLSEHTSATEAELAAQAHAQDRDAERVVLHDRYHRTHDAAPSPVGYLGAGAALPRTPARPRSRRRSPARPGASALTIGP